MGTIFGAILGAIGSFFARWLTGRQARKDQIELGQERQRNKSLEDDAAARRRVAEAEAKPRGDKEVEKDMDRGTF